MSKPKWLPRCSRKGFCSGMGPNITFGERRGLNSVILTNLKTLKKRFAGVRYCLTNSKKDVGIMLNFCPWCGASLQFWEKK